MEQISVGPCQLFNPQPSFSSAQPNSQSGVLIASQSPNLIQIASSLIIHAKCRRRRPHTKGGCQRVILLCQGPRLSVPLFCAALDCLRAPLPSPPLPTNYCTYSSTIGLLLFIVPPAHTVCSTAAFAAADCF
jgi:hypothetical protein